MANLASMVEAGVASLLTAQVGKDFRLNALVQSSAPVPAVLETSVLTGNTPAELLEIGTNVRFPTVTVACSKLKNDLREKFRTFSGTAQVSVEIRFSQDRIQEIQPTLEAYVSGVCQVLDSSRGDLGNGMFYAGGYEVIFSPVKKGGINFTQSARVSFDVNLNV